MYTDEAIKEIRNVRQKISAEYDHNTKALLDHYKKLEQKYKNRILSKKKIVKMSSDKKQLQHFKNS